MISRIEQIDSIAQKIGKPLKEEKIELALYGDSILEEYSRADEDMLEDDYQIRETLGSRGFIEAEPIENKVPENFSFIKSSDIAEDFTIEYFIDGSIRTKYIGELLTYGGSIIASHVGAIAVKINYKQQNLIPYSFKINLTLYFPDSLPDTVKQKLQQIINNDLSIEFLQLGANETSLRSTAGGKARHKMHEIEIDVAKKLPSDRRWLAMDGALRRPEFYSLDKTIGIAKSFSTKIWFLGNDGKPKRNISHLAGLRKGHRSPVYRYKIINRNEENEGLDVEKIVFWFLRLRESPPEMAPLGGIIKIDLGMGINEDPDKIAKIADSISYSILKIKDPSIFSWPRWPSYIYPIRVCEEYLSSLLFNQYEFNRLGIKLRSVI